MKRKQDILSKLAEARNTLLDLVNLGIRRTGDNLETPIEIWGRLKAGDLDRMTPYRSLPLFGALQS